MLDEPLARGAAGGVSHPARRPDFFIVGAPRSATTAMFAYLSQHPQIFFPFRKEVHYFGSDLTKVPDTPWFVRDEREYLSLFREAPENCVVGEASVLYLYSKTAAVEIRAFQPEAKILIQLRNPIDMMYSYHGQLLLAVQEDIEDFEGALAAVEERRRHQRIPRFCVIPDQLLYFDIARYAEQVQRYYAAFGRERVHVVLYDDLERDAAAEFRKVLAFLEVDPGFRPPFESINSHRRVRSRRLQGETQRPSAVTRALLRLVPDRVGYVGLIRLATWNSAPAKRPPLPAPLRRKLARELEGEVKLLGELLERNLDHWLASDRGG
jgi:hypothetical protein